MNSLHFLFIGLALVWTLIGGYVWFLASRQTRLRREVEELKAQLIRPGDTERNSSALDGRQDARPGESGRHEP